MAWHVWVLHQQRKVGCKKGDWRCLTTSEVTFYPDPSPALLTPPPSQPHENENIFTQSFQFSLIASSSPFFHLQPHSYLYHPMHYGAAVKWGQKWPTLENPKFWQRKSVLVSNFSNTGSETFFRYQILPIPVPSLFSSTKSFRNRFRDFFRYQFVPILVQIPPKK